MMPLPSFGDRDDDLVSSSAVGFLTSALTEPLPADKDVLIVAVPASFEAAEKFLRLVPREYGFLWRSPTSAQMAGGGATITLTGSGPDRFRELREAIAGVWDRICVRSLDDKDMPPALVGGVSFMPGVPDTDPWTEFGHDAFTLPKWGYRRDGRNAHLLLSATRRELAQPQLVATMLADAQRILAGLEKESATTLIQRPNVTDHHIHDMSLGEWQVYIDQIKQVIASGQYEKLVAARRRVIDLPVDLDDTIFLARLCAAYADCTHYAIRRENSTFLGATPETLFRKLGKMVFTHALAGTERVTNDLWAPTSVSAASLVASTKNRTEHELVVRDICADLAELSVNIQYEPTPLIRRVRDLIHLMTPISCELRDDVDPFQLIEALHPTPAVGGLPTRTAGQWLRDNEPIERGWYTGAVGWLDSTGNAEFAVAIRCGVLTRNRIHLYAGAGIVSESDAEAEYRETAAKMAPFMRALAIQV